MAYSQIETRGQFVRLLGLGASGRNLTRRWEKNPTDAGAQRPGVVSLRRMLYLVVWQMTGVLYISDLDEVDWNRRLVVPRDELKPPVSPFLKVVGVVASGGTTRPKITSTAPPKNVFRLSLRLLGKRNYPWALKQTDLGRLLGLKPRRDMGMAYRWNDGRRQMPQDATIRMLIVLLWDALGIAKATALYAVDWDTRVSSGSTARKTGAERGCSQSPLAPPHRYQPSETTSCRGASTRSASPPRAPASCSTPTSTSPYRRRGCRS